MTCACRGKGLIKVNYHDGSAFDLGVCRCPYGQAIRSKGPNGYALYALSYGIDRTRVQPIEDLADEAEIVALGLMPAASVPLGDFTQAGGKAPKKAHL